MSTRGAIVTHGARATRRVRRQLKGEQRVAVGELGRGELGRADERIGYQNKRVRLDFVSQLRPQLNSESRARARARLSSPSPSPWLPRFRDAGRR